MDKASKRFIEKNYFEVSPEEYGGRAGYYDLSFGDENAKTVINCHEKHLKELKRIISEEIKV